MNINGHWLFVFLIFHGLASNENRAMGNGPVKLSTKIETIEDLWAGFDPRTLPLEIEIVKSWDEQDVHLEMLYFTGEVFEGKKTRVFGYLGLPKKVEGKIPGLVHVHGGGQTAVLDWPRFWAKRGYACLSFDFCGNTNLPQLGAGYKREHYTRWEKVPADMMRIGAGLQMTPTPRYNPWFHWTLAARRGLTLLESRPEVDKENLGVFGISVGGTLIWSIASLDSRVKAAAPIYGCGWEFYQYPPDFSETISDDLRLWRKLIAPESHAPRIKCPLMLFSATNDGHGRMDLAFRTLGMLGSTVKNHVFTPNYDHHIEPEEARSLPLFMDCHLKGKPPEWPATPSLAIISGKNGIPMVQVSTKQVELVERVDVYYCLNNDWPTTRFWRSTGKTERQGDSHVALTPFLTEADTIIAFANVNYRSGIRLSSPMVTKAVSKIPGTRPTLKRQAQIDSMDASTDWNWVPAYTDPCREDRFFSSWKGPGGQCGFTLDPGTFHFGGSMHYYFGTRKIGDPQFHGKGRRTLLLDYPVENTPEKLTVRLTNREPGQNGVEFTAQISFDEKAKGTWETLSMQANQFRDINGKVLSRWDHVEYFVLNGINPTNKPPVFKRLRWED